MWNNTFKVNELNRTYMFFPLLSPFFSFLFSVCNHWLLSLQKSIQKEQYPLHTADKSIPVKPEWTMEERSRAGLKRNQVGTGRSPQGLLVWCVFGGKVDDWAANALRQPSRQPSHIPFFATTILHSASSCVVTNYTVLPVHTFDSSISL